MANQVTVNVGDLSNALALAVQQAIQPGSIPISTQPASAGSSESNTVPSTSTCLV